MVLPTTHLAEILLLLACVFAWAIWIFLSRAAADRGRYELYYFDVCVGLLGTAGAIVFTLGTLGSDMTFGDRLLVAGLTAKAWTALGGACLALGNYLFLAGLSLKNKAAPVISVVATLALSFSWVYSAKGGTTLLPILILCAVVIGVIGFALSAAATQNSKTKALAKSKAICLAGSIFLGGFYPAVRKGLYTDIGVGPYGALIIGAITILAFSLFLSVYFFNLPVNGSPVGLRVYRASSMAQHLRGWLGGVLYGLALFCFLLGISVGAVAI